MRRVKKTTNEQFDLLKAEMAMHPAAARGYGVGAQRAIVDAEWRNIVDKLNALGPPERTMTEWKKVWSDVRLRIKKQNMGEIKKPKKKKTKKPKKEPIDPAEDQLMEALNSSISIYGTHIKTENSDDDKTQDASQDNDSTCDDYEDEEIKTVDNNSTYDKSRLRKSNKTQVLQSDDDDDEDNDDNIEQTLTAVQQQLDQQNKLISNLLKVSSNMSLLMKRYMKAEEKKTSIMQRQYKSNEYHNLFLRRQDSRRKLKSITQRTETD